MARPRPTSRHPGHVEALDVVRKTGLSPEKLAQHLDEVALLLGAAAVDSASSPYDKGQAVIAVVRDHIAQVTVATDRRQLELLFGIGEDRGGDSYKRRADLANVAYVTDKRGERADPINPKEYAARHVPALLDQVATLIARDHGLTDGPAPTPPSPPPPSPPPPARRAMKLPLVLAAAFVVVAAVLAIVASDEGTGRPAVGITRPASESSVGASVSVEGTAWGLGADQELWLVVKPHGAALYYPQQRAVSVVGRRWSGPVSLGDGTPRTDNERFTILAVVVTRGGANELRRAVDASSPGLADLPRMLAEASIDVSLKP